MPTYLRQEELLDFSEFTDPNNLFKWHLCIVAYRGSMSQNSWPIAEYN